LNSQLATKRYNSPMSVKYQVRKVRRDGVTQRYWIAPTRDHIRSVESLVVKQLQHALETGQPPQISPASNDGLFHAYANALQRKLGFLSDIEAEQLLIHLAPYLSRNLPEAQRLIVRLATEVPHRRLRRIAMNMCGHSVYEAPSLFGEIAMQSPDDWGVTMALRDLQEYIEDGLRSLFDPLFRVSGLKIDKSKFKRSLAKGIDVLIEALNEFDGKRQIPRETLAETVVWMRNNIGDILELPLTQMARCKMEVTMQAIAKRDDLDYHVRHDAARVAQELQKQYGL
jgi:hypothetical protein